MKELYKKYRPKTFDKILGQKHIVKSLERWVERGTLPHTLLFSGPSGCGKTTLARILRRELGCGKHDFTEINCADFRGIDMVRNIRLRMHQAPISGECRIWLIDEAHKLSNDAQNAFLKMLEDTPKHVYFMLATTDPQRLLRTIRNRCSEIAVKPLTSKTTKKLVTSISKKEGMKIPPEVVDKIIENSEGSARKALVSLNQVIELDDEEEMLEAIQASVIEIQASEISKLLLRPRVSWLDVAKVLRVIGNNEAEQIRHMVLGYARAVILGGGKTAGRAFVIIEAFSDNFFDSKAAGLAAACYEVMVESKIK